MNQVETPSPAKAFLLKIRDAERSGAIVTLTVAEANELFDIILFEWECNHFEHCGCDDTPTSGGDGKNCKWPYPGSERRKDQ